MAPRSAGWWWMKEARYKWYSRVKVRASSRGGYEAYIEGEWGDGWIPCSRVRWEESEPFHTLWQRIKPMPKWEEVSDG